METKSNSEIRQLVKYLIKTEVGGWESLAQRFGVSVSTLNRWATGTTRPRPNFEGKIRALAAKREAKNIMINQNQFRFDFKDQGKDESDLRLVMGNTLKEIREILHRSGRLSSRHEALDEIAKLLFAHIISLNTGGTGICEEIVNDKKGPASSLKGFVAGLVEQHLPESLSNELGVKDFKLKIKDTEELFATEMIGCFEKLATAEAMSQIHGPDGVDILNDTFGHFLADSFVEEKELGQYLTPTDVVRFMVRLGLSSLSKKDLDALIDPERCAKVGTILDPSCGVGSFLTETLRVLHRQVQNKYGDAGTKKWINEIMRSGIIGIDKSERMIRLSLTNMALFGVPAANLHLMNALVRSGSDAKVTDELENRAKLIYTNPPFGANFQEKEIQKFKIASKWASRKPKSIDSEILFIERYINWLAPGGILVAIVPDSILTNKGLFEDLRKGILPRVEILSVISLPKVTFGVAGTNTKTSILHLKKRNGRKANRHDVYFAVCKNIGYDISTRSAHRRKILNGKNDLNKISGEAYRNTDPAIGRLIRLDQDCRRWDAIYHAGLPTYIQARIDNKTNDDVFVSDVAFLSNEREDPRRRGDEYFKYIEIADVDAKTNNVGSKLLRCEDAPGRARKCVKEDDVLISTVRPERKAIGVVPNDLDGAICSTGFAGLRCTKIHPYVLARLLQSDFSNAQILRNNVGISYPAIDEQCLVGVMLPVNRKNLDRLNEEADALKNAWKMLKDQEKAFEESVNSLVDKWFD